MEGQERAYRAVEALFAEPPRIYAHKRPAQEPVAWMYEKNGLHVLHFTRTPEYVTKMGHTETPLYAAPQPALLPESFA